MSECPYCQNSFEMTETCSDEFTMWQGLVGPYYTPSVDEDGILSWTNTGGLPNPDPIDISGPAGASFSIEGIVDTVSQLPSGGAEGVWLVGTEAPYEGYSFVSGAWADIGQLAVGPRGEQGEPGTPGQDGISAGFGTPTATITNTTGTPSVTVTASGPDTAKVFAFAFANLKGAKGDTGSKGDPGEVTQTEFDELADDVDNLRTFINNLDADDVGAMSMDLLWTNASPRSAFAAQTISLDLSGYDFVRIGYLWTNANNDTAVIILDTKVGSSGRAFRVDFTGTSNFWYAVRNLTVSSSSVVFADASQAVTSGSGLSTNNTSNIPQYIYGYKA